MKLLTRFKCKWTSKWKGTFVDETPSPLHEVAENGGAVEKLGAENHTLKKEIKHLEQSMSSKVSISFLWKLIHTKQTFLYIFPTFTP